MKRIEFTWTVRGALHMGTGMSRLGEVDRIIRTTGKATRPAIEGEQVKGAVRGAAERLARWLGAEIEDTHTSYPKHPVLRRLFAPDGQALVRFEPLTYVKSARLAIVASTAIDHGTGAARKHTLRNIEALDRGAGFRGRIVLYGDWTSERAQRDVEFLCCAVLAADAIGSRKGTGFGAVDIESLSCNLIDVNRLSDPATIERLRRHLEAGA